MRFAITAMATDGKLPVVEQEGDMEVDGAERDVLGDLRALRSELEALDVGRGGHFARDVEKKMEVMRTCVEKVERALYGLVIRGRERSKGWMPDLDAGSRDVEVGA